MWRNSTLRKPLITVAVSVVLLAILVLPLAQIPRISATEFSAKDEALVFLRDVVGLDISKYGLGLKDNSFRNNPNFGGLGEWLVTYSLVSRNSTLDATCRFINNTLDTCSLYIIVGRLTY